MFLPTGDAVASSQTCVKQACRQEEKKGTFVVLDTPAGTLVRADDAAAVIAFPELAQRSPEKSGELLKPSVGGTYFIDYNRYRTFTVNGTNHYATQGNNFHKARYAHLSTHTGLPPPIILQGRPSTRPDTVI